MKGMTEKGTNLKFKHCEGFGERGELISPGLVNAVNLRFLSSFFSHGGKFIFVDRINW